MRKHLPMLRTRTIKRKKISQLVRSCHMAFVENFNLCEDFRCSLAFFLFIFSLIEWYIIIDKKKLVCCGIRSFEVERENKLILEIEIIFVLLVKTRGGWRRQLERKEEDQNDRCEFVWRLEEESEMFVLDTRKLVHRTYGFFEFEIYASLCICLIG